LDAAESVTARIDQVIDNFNRRKMDLPDGFFDRQTQFLINGAAFESLLSATPNDPLVLMLARGPAGYRFTIKALQHAIPDAKIDRGDVVTNGDLLNVSVKLWLSGTLRGTGERIEALADISLRVTPTGSIETAEATMDPAHLGKIHEARLRT
jgi:hypothetical protein